MTLHCECRDLYCEFIHAIAAPWIGKITRKDRMIFYLHNSIIIVRLRHRNICSGLTFVSRSIERTMWFGFFDISLANILIIIPLQTAVFIIFTNKTVIIGKQRRICLVLSLKLMFCFLVAEVQDVGCSTDDVYFVKGKLLLPFNIIFKKVILTDRV